MSNAAAGGVLLVTALRLTSITLQKHLHVHGRLPVLVCLANAEVQLKISKQLSGLAPSFRHDDGLDLHEALL